MTSQPSLFDVAGSGVAPHKLPTNLTTRNHAVHRWMNFTAGYSPEFVHQCLARDGVSGGSVLDPFSGMGTTLVAANSAGLNAVGYDPHPHAAMMCRAKTQSRSLRAVDRIEEVLRSLEAVSSVDAQWNEGQLKFLGKLIEPDQLGYLASARNLEEELEPDDRPLYRLVVTRLLESASGSATDGIYKAPTSKKRARPVKESYPRVLRELREDIGAIGDDWGISEVYESSSEEMTDIPSGEICQVITSPPYLNNFDFAEMTRMEIYFWDYATSWGDITAKVRSKLVVNTTTAPTEFKKAQDIWRNYLSAEVSGECLNYVEALAEARAEKARSKDYDRLVYPYFAQMQNVIRESYRVLKPGGAMDLVVSDAALYGVHIHTEDVLRRIMLESGFEAVGVVRLRTRGDRWVLSKRTGSKDPLGEFHLTARKG